MCVSTPTVMRLPVYAYGSETYIPFPLSPPPPSDRSWQSPPGVPDDRLTNVEGLLLDLVNSLGDPAATVRPDRVVYHSFLPSTELRLPTADLQAGWEGYMRSAYN